MFSLLKKIFFILVVPVLIWDCHGFGLNLVNNPGFENFSACPHSVGEVSKCIGWSSFGNSSDYFNSCDTGIVDVPNNLFSNLPALKGSAYCGFFNFIPFSNYREYIGAKLNDSLQINIKYFISLNFSLAKSQGNNCWSNNAGILFSTIPYFDSLPPIQTNFCHLFSAALITDTTNWVNISGSFIADSNYKYVIVGNFFDNLHTDTLNCYSASWSSYFFVDEICVSSDSILCASINNIPSYPNSYYQDNIKVFPNPAGSYFFIESNSNILIKDVLIVNNLGEPIKIHKEFVSLRKYRIEFINKTDGFYYIKIQTNSRVLTSKIIVNTKIN